MEIWVDGEQHICDLCEETNGCAELIDDKKIMRIGYLCYLCLGVAIDAILNTKLINQIRNVAAIKDAAGRIPVKELRQVDIEVRQHSDARSTRKRGEPSYQGKDRRIGRRANRHHGTRTGHGEDTGDG